MKSFEGYLKRKLGDSYALLAGGGSTIDKGFNSGGNIILDTSGGGASPYLGFKRGAWENLDYWDWKTYNLSGELTFDVFDNTNSWVNVFKITNTAAYIKGNLVYHAGNLPAYPTKASWDYDDRYVKLSAIELTIESTIDSLGKGAIELYRNCESGYSMIGFATKISGTKTSLGMLGFTETANIPYFRDTSGNLRALLHSNNYTSYVYDKSTSDGRYVYVGGDTMTGKLTIKTSSYRDLLTIYRNENNNNCVINFENKDGVLGAIGFTGLGLTGMVEMAHIIDKAGNLYPILHSGNYTTWINTTNFPGLNSVNTDSLVEQHNVSGEGYTNLRPLLFSDTSHASSPSSFASVTARTYFTPNIYGQPEYGNLFLSGKITAGSGDFTGNIILGTSGSGATPCLGFKRGTWENSGANDWRVYCTSGDLYFDVYSASPSDGWHTVMRIADSYNLYVNGSTVYHSGNLTYGTLGLNLRTISLNGSGYTYISPYRDATDGYPAWFAPTSAGTSNYILKSNGSGAPSWTNAPTLTGNLTLYSASGDTPLLRFLRGVWENNSLYDWRIYNSGGELYFDVYDVNGWSNSFRMGISDTSYATYIHGNLVYHSGNLPDVNNVNITVANSGYTDYRPMLTSDSTSTASIDPSFSGGNHKLLASNKIYFSPGTGNMTTLGNIKLYTSGTGATPALIFLRMSDSDTSYNDWKIYGKDGYFYIDLCYLGSWRNAIWIHENGSVYASNFYTTSDSRKKKEIKQISNSIYQFKLKDLDTLLYGYIAQELEKTNPELVDSSSEYKTVNYNSAICYSISKIENTMKAKIIELELRLEKLELAPPKFELRAKMIEMWPQRKGVAA